MKASIGLMTFALAAAPAWAQPPELSPTHEATQTAANEEVAAGESSGITDVAMVTVRRGNDETLSLEELGELRGGEAIVIQHTTQTLTATNSGNAVNGDTIGSGAVNLSSDAFRGYDGIGNFVINTGHNNNLQGSISVNITMTPQ